MLAFWSQHVQKYYSQSLIFRLLLGGTIVLTYFLLLRPARLFVTEKVVYPQIQYLDDTATTYNSTLRSGSILIQYEYRNKIKKLSYRPKFGFFFLVSFMALLFISESKRPYLLLILLHLSTTILAYLFLITGACDIPLGFVLTDAFNGYLTPALSLALVPLVVKGLVR